MAKTLRTLSATDFTTKGSTLTWEELDQNFIDLYAELRDGSSDLDLNSIDINGSTFVDSSRNLEANTVRTDTGKFLAPTSYAFRDASDSSYRDVQMAGLTATTGKFSDVLTANANIDVNDDIKLDDATTNISTDTFASGFAGTGLAFLQDSTWDGTLDNLTVRQRLRVYELLINQIRATNGSLVVTSATKTGREDDLGFAPVQQQGGTLDWTSTDPFWTETDQYWYRTYRVYIEENQFVPFVEDDLVIAQRFTGNGVYVVEGTVVNVENGSATVTDNSTRRYFDINITEDSDVPASSMDFVRWGNLTDPDRQGVLYLTADDDDAPYMDIVYGMDAHSKRNASSTVKGRIGRLDGIIDNDFPTLDGTQTNEFGVYIDGGYFNNVEVRGTITILDDDASNAATKDYVDSAAASGSQIIRSDSEPTTRDDGSSLREGDIWIETDNGDKPYTYNGTIFVEAYTIIDGGNLTTGSVTAAKIAANTITANEIAANTITASQIAADTITANEIAADTITADKLTAFSTSANEYAGIQAGSGSTKNFFAGAEDANGTNATAFITADGTITHDGYARIVYNKFSEAGFGINDNADQLDNDEYHNRASATGGNTDTGEAYKIRVPYTHIRNEGYLKIHGFCRSDLTTDGAGVDSNAIIRGSIEPIGGRANPGISNTFAIGANSSETEFEFDLDVGILGDNTTYWLYIELDVSLDATNGTGSFTYQQDGWIREDLSVIATQVQLPQNFNP